MLLLLKVAGFNRNVYAPRFSVAVKSDADDGGGAR